MTRPTVSKRYALEGSRFNTGEPAQAPARPEIGADDEPTPWVQECYLCGYRVTLFDTEYDTRQNRNYLLTLGWTEHKGIGWRCSRCSKAYDAASRISLPAPPDLGF